MAAMTKYHVQRKTVPISRLLAFDPGEDSVTVSCYLHTSDHAPQGWYDEVEKEVSLRHSFSGI